MVRLIIGFRKFRDRYFQEENNFYAKLSTGQSPKTLIIACSDSRVDPAILTSASPGELFIVRNVANLVPPYETSRGFHGVSSAIEFAVVNLKVENIVIMGHRQCGGIRALMTDLSLSNPESFVGQWMQIADPAKRKVLAEQSHKDPETQIRCCEMESIICSIQNLKTFPFVQEALLTRELNIVGTYFDLEQGQLFNYEEDTQQFRQVEV